MRWPPVDADGLKFHLEEVDPPPFYFNGMTARFRLIIENPGDTASTVRSALDFAMRTPNASFGERGDNLTHLVIPPHSSVPYDCIPQWLMVGEGTYQLNVPQRSTVPLADFTVHDKDLKDERDWHAGYQETIARRTLFAFVLSIFASSFVAIVGLLLAFHH